MEWLLTRNSFLLFLLVAALVCYRSCTSGSSAPSTSRSSYSELLESFASVKNDLVELCRDTRKLGPDHACDGIDTPLFANFLKLLGNQLVEQVGNENHHQDTLNPSTWLERCQAQLQLKDTRTPPVCVAASYTLVPFALHKSKQNMQISTMGDLKGPLQDFSHLRLVTVSVDSNYRHHKAPTPYSACLQRVKINILGKGIKNFYTKGLGGKAALLRSFMERNVPKDDNNTVVLFVDGSDVLFQGDELEILRRFTHSNARVLFSAEHACYPMKYFPWNLNTGEWIAPCSGACSNSRYVCDHLFPQPHENNSLSRVLGNRWLNSGGFIGYSPEIHEILHDISTIPEDILNKWPGFDQGLYTNMFLGGKWKIELDYFNLVFQSWGLVKDPYEPTPPNTDMNSHNLIVPMKGHGHYKWINPHIGRVSPILHFNADGKGSGMFKRVFKSIHQHSRFNFSDTSCAALHNVVPVPEQLM